MKALDELREYAGNFCGIIGETLTILTEDIEAELAERYVALPLGAVGEPIRVGDYVEETDTRLIGRAHGEVVRISFGKHAASIRIDTGLGYGDYAPQSVRHITKKPTVEDVLMEFHERMDELGTTDQCVGIDRADAVDALLRERAKLVAEYIAKLQLREDE